MLRAYVKSIRLNNRFFCSKYVRVPNKSPKPYEIAESEEIDIRKVDAEKYNSSPKKKVINKKSKWGDFTINME